MSDKTVLEPGQAMFMVCETSNPLVWEKLVPMEKLFWADREVNYLEALRGTPNSWAVIPFVYVKPPPEYVHRALTAKFSNGGALNLTVSHDSVAECVDAVIEAVASLTLDENGALEFELRYFSIDDDENNLEITVGKSEYMPEMVEHLTLHQIVAELVRQTRVKFLCALANQQITLHGEQGSLLPLD